MRQALFTSHYTAQTGAIRAGLAPANTPPQPNSTFSGWRRQARRTRLGTLGHSFFKRRLVRCGFLQFAVVALTLHRRLRSTGGRISLLPDKTALLVFKLPCVGRGRRRRFCANVLILGRSLFTLPLILARTFDIAGGIVRVFFICLEPLHFCRATLLAFSVVELGLLSFEVIRLLTSTLPTFTQATVHCKLLIARSALSGRGPGNCGAFVGDSGALGRDIQTAHRAVCLSQRAKGCTSQQHR